MTREEILKEFQDIEGINEAKKIYKTLAKKLHPDVGGSEEDFKILNEIYNNLIEHKIYFSNSSKFDIPCISKLTLLSTMFNFIL